jgi:hypothetical protein
MSKNKEVTVLIFRCHTLTDFTQSIKLRFSGRKETGFHTPISQ